MSAIRGGPTLRFLNTRSILQSQATVYAHTCLRTRQCLPPFRVANDVCLATLRNRMSFTREESGRGIEHHVMLAIFSVEDMSSGGRTQRSKGDDWRVAGSTISTAKMLLTKKTKRSFFTYILVCTGVFGVCILAESIFVFENGFGRANLQGFASTVSSTTFSETYEIFNQRYFTGTVLRLLITV